MKFVWVTINVKDFKESLEFYQDIIGLKLDRTINPMPGTDIAFLGNGSTEVEIICDADNSNAQYGKDISLGFGVENLDAEIEILKEKGVSNIMGPFQPNPMVKFIYIMDPNGLKIQLVEMPKK